MDPFLLSQEIIPPLGSQPEHHHRPENIIDLTSDDDQDAHNNTSSDNSDGNRDEDAGEEDGDDDDIVFTGESRPAQPSPPPRAATRALFRPTRRGILRPAAQPSQSSDHAQPSHSSSSNHSGATATSSVGNYSNLPGPMAALTANIYAGYFSRNHPRADPTPQPSSSNLTVRDAPAPQTRRPINVGGGGRFSGGHFSGFVAAGLSRFRGLLGPASAAPTRIRPQPPPDSLHRVFSNWTHDDDFDQLDSDRFGGLAGQLRGDFLALSHHQLLTAIYDFDHTHHPQEPMPPSYKEQDSHPLKIKSGFSKEIIPLDREVLSVDSDSHSYPQLEKQELRPICASCDDELLMDQDSCVGGSLEGRRPWILACGHVVDSRCLELARIRARENKFESHQSKKARAAERLAKSRVQTRAGRPSRLNQAADAPAKSAGNNNKRRKISSTHPTQTSPSSTSVDLASRRKERADAREARKSIELSKPMSSHLSDSLHPTETESAPHNLTITSGQNSKGKGKAKAETSPFPATEDSSSITIPPTPDPAHPPTEPASTARDTHATKPAACSSAPFASWINCPVKGCRGAKGDLLAPPGSKNAPWEMFV